MRRTLSAVLTLAALLPCIPGPAQMHKVAKPEQVVRAVGVYEWTGDLKKPTASRLIPVTLFINGTLEDAGIYLPQPIPFALTPGNEYELQQAGIARGMLDLSYAGHLQTADSAFDDGWFGYGSFKAPAAPKKQTTLRASRTQPAITSSKDDSRPHFGGRSQTPASSGTDTAQTGKDSTPSTADQKDPSADKSTGSKGTDDSDRPTMRRRGDSTSTDTSTTSSPSDDPDRPTMHRRSDSSTTDTSTGSTPAEDPDRPTLRRHSPDDARKSKQSENDVASVSGTGSLNNDPDRPKLQRGAHSTANDTEVAKLVGTPKDLHQMVAVSDASNRPPHDFARAWQDDAERAAVLAKLQALAQTQLRAYAATQPATPARKAPAASASSRRRPPARSAKPAAPDQIPLLDEDVKAYTLSYGGAPTYVYTAHTAGTGADLRYVTVVAQSDIGDDLRAAITSVTDETHLDVKPRMQFVDVVDVEASNRASLLFELRSRSARQFVLYRVIGARADAIFTTGTTQ